MIIAIIDAEIMGKKKHRFPNLSCMKLSAFHKRKQHSVTLKTDWGNLSNFNKVYISKVFTSTPVPESVLALQNVIYGGSGFFYDNAPRLPNEIEHAMPDHDLYKEWVALCISQGVKATEFKYFTDYSIGMATRGCFRRCGFCINRNSKGSKVHSPISEFHDPNRKKICLLDDNFFACKDWRKILSELQTTSKRFQFKQGLDIRLMDEEKCKALSECKYDGDYFFAFDNVDDAKVIERNINLLRQHSSRRATVYTFCAYDRSGVYDTSFWVNDIIGIFKRLAILAKYNCKPYLMRFEKYKDSPFGKLYSDMATWCNFFPYFQKQSFMEFCENRGVGAKASAENFLFNNPEFKNYFYKRH